MKKIKLFCLAYAGGTAMIYSRWKKWMDKSIEIVPIELAGRGIRGKEPFFASLDEAAEDVYARIKEAADGSPFAIFGHSMGALLTYEVMHKMQDRGDEMPVYAFLSGRNAPHVEVENKMIHLLPDDLFIQEIARIGGTPKEFFEQKQLLDMFIPILKADYKMIETHPFVPKAEKLDVEIAVLGGTEDEDVKVEDLGKWGDLVKRNCSVYVFEGGHFFIFDKYPDIIDLIGSKLTNLHHS
jgi:medium-chain acyl-[acyl-carrier-protein] hydrolase